MFFSAAVAQEIESNHTLLWEITGDNLKLPSYLFGTLHTNDKRVFNFSDSLYYALDNAESIVLERDNFNLFGELELRINKPNFLIDKNGDPYSSSSFPTRTIYGDEDGMPQFLDAYFQDYCYNAGKKFEILESADLLAEPVGSMEGVSSKLGSLLTNDEQLIQLYMDGDIFRLNQFVQRNLQITSETFAKTMLDRNRRLIHVLDSLIAKSSVFCAIGAWHLAGNEGVINLLRKRGYKLRALGSDFSEELLESKMNIRNAQNYGYFNDSLMVHAVFPGRPKQETNTTTGAVLSLIYQQLGQGNSYILEVYNRNSEINEDTEAELYIPSPSKARFRKILGENSSFYYEGIADTYPEGLYWTRVMLKDQYVLVLKAYGGNKFMSSTRPFDFFDKVHFEE